VVAAAGGLNGASPEAVECGELKQPEATAKLDENAAVLCRPRALGANWRNEGQ
jgi:hypothetical protein